jgi:hypothetical protein
MSRGQSSGRLALLITVSYIWLISFLLVIGADRVPNAIELWLLACVPCVSAAIDRTSTVREQLKTEQAAFKQFAKRVAALYPPQSMPQERIWHSVNDDVAQPI